MKARHSFFLSCLFLLSVHASAQDETETFTRPLKIGVKIGGNLSQLSQPGSVIGANAGGFVRYDVIPFLQVEGGIQYSLTGGGRRDLNRDLSLFIDGDLVFDLEGPIVELQYLNRQVYLHAIEAPFSVRITHPELADASIQPRLIAGASYSYIYGAVESRDVLFGFEDGTSTILSDQDEIVSEDYFNSNFQIHGGMGVDFNLPNNQTFSMEFIYKHGLTDLNDIQNGQPENIQSMYSRGFHFNFFYSIF